MEGARTEHERYVREFTPSKRPYLVFFLCFLLPTVLMFYGFFSKSDLNGLLMGFVCLLFLFSLWLWVFQNRVSFSSDGVTHGRFRPFQRYLAFSEMRDFYTFVGFRDDRGRTGPFIRLVIEPKPESNKQAIVIPFRLFSATDSKAIIELLSGRLPKRKARSARTKR